MSHGFTTHIRFLCVLLCNALATTTLAETTLSVSCASNPFHVWESEQGGFEGPVMDILTQVTALTGIQFQIDIYPIPRLHHNGKQGVSQLICPVFFKEERREWLDYFDKTHAYVAKYVAWNLKTDPTNYTGDFEELLGKHIGIEKGITTDKVLLDYAEAGKVQLSFVGRAEALLKMVENGRVDLALGNLSTYEIRLENLGKRDLYKHSESLYIEKGLFALSKRASISNREHVYNAIEEALDTLDKNGFLKNLESKYDHVYH